MFKNVFRFKSPVHSNLSNLPENIYFPILPIFNLFVKYFLRHHVFNKLNMIICKKRSILIALQHATHTECQRGE